MSARVIIELGSIPRYLVTKGSVINSFEKGIRVRVDSDRQSMAGLVFGALETHAKDTEISSGAASWLET